MHASQVATLEAERDELTAAQATLQQGIKGDLLQQQVSSALKSEPDICVSTTASLAVQAAVKRDIGA